MRPAFLLVSALLLVSCSVSGALAVHHLFRAVPLHSSNATDKAVPAASANDNSKQPESNKNAKSAAEGHVPKPRTMSFSATSASITPKDPFRDAFAAVATPAVLNSIIRVSAVQFQALKKMMQDRAALEADDPKSIGHELVKRWQAASSSRSGQRPRARTARGSTSNRPAAAFLESRARSQSKRSTNEVWCDWAESEFEQPQTGVRNPPGSGLAQENDYVWYASERGHGASSMAANDRRCEYSLFSFSQYCRCSFTSKDVASGRATMGMSVQVMCVEMLPDHRHRYVPPPNDCRTDLRLQMSYVGVASVTTGGGTCLPFSPTIDAMATNEVAGKINERDALVKAGSAQSGSKVTSTISYELAGTGTRGERASSEIGVTFGYTEKIERNYGSKSADIIGFASHQSAGPSQHGVTAQIDTVSHAVISAESFAWGSAVAQTLGAGIWYGGISDCPGITHPALGWIAVGVAEQYDALRRQAVTFEHMYRSITVVN